MSIKVKAIEKSISFDKNSEKCDYVLQPERYSRLSASKVIVEASTRSGLSKCAMTAAWAAIGNVITITAWTTEGHSVVAPGLGARRFGLRCASVAGVGGVSANFVTSRRVIPPPREMKQQLNTTAISITRYGRTGKLVKQITGDDLGTVDDPDVPATGDSTDTGTGTGGTTPDDDLGGNVSQPTPRTPSPKRKPSEDSENPPAQGE